MGEIDKIRQKRDRARNIHSDNYVVLPDETPDLWRTRYGDIEIECRYSNPPWGVFGKIRACLRQINKHHLQGLGKIILTDEIKYLTPDVDDAISSRGVYIYPTNDTPPMIILAIPEFYKWVPRWMWLSPIITLRLGHTLLHEVGHHVAFMNDNRHQESKSDERELLANSYADAVMKSMAQRWYYKIGDFLIKELASWYFALGVAAANYDHNQRAITRFYAAWHLDPKHKYAADYYWKTRRIYEKSTEEHRQK